MIFLIIALTLNTVITVIFIITNRNKQYVNTIAFTAMLLLVPFLGFLIYFVPHLMFKAIHKRNLYDTNDLIVSREDEKYISKPNLKEELNIVPFSEMLAVGETDHKRALILDILKKDMINNSRITQTALDDSDSETSHYAAAATMEVYRKIKLGIQEMETQLSLDTSNVELRRALLDEIYRYIDTGVLSQRDRYFNINKYIKLMNEMLEKNEDRLSTEDFIHQIDFLAEINRQHDAEALCRYVKLKNPNELIYLKLMELYFNMRNRAEFEKTFQELRQSNIILSNKGMEILRFWMIRGE